MNISQKDFRKGEREETGTAGSPVTETMQKETYENTVRGQLRQSCRTRKKEGEKLTGPFPFHLLLGGGF